MAPTPGPVVMYELALSFTDLGAANAADQYTNGVLTGGYHYRRAAACVVASQTHHVKDPKGGDFTPNSTYITDTKTASGRLIGASWIVMGTDADITAMISDWTGFKYVTVVKFPYP